MTPDDLLPAIALGFVLAVLWHASRRSEHAPAQTWDNEKVVPVDGGVIQRRLPTMAEIQANPELALTTVHPDQMIRSVTPPPLPLPYRAFVVPATGRKCELDAEDGTVCRIIDPVFRPMHVAKGQTDAEIIDCITALWRPTPEGT